jgi:outer membrane protein OmpA-like peptidoglycan-associated protein/tetratricopeptide (TPR) repeat protein
MKNIYIVLSFVLTISSINAQNNDTKAADKLFERYEYVNAAKQYLKLTDTGKADEYVYKQLGDCYYNIFNAIEAEKWYTKAVTKQQDPETYFRYAQMLKANKKNTEASTMMAKFSSLSPSDKRATNLVDEEDYLNQLLAKSKLFDVKPIGINTKYSDFGAYLNNGIVYFASARNASRKNYSWNDQPFLDIYKADYKDGKISEQVTIDNDLNTKYHEGTVTISADGNTMYFSRESFFDNKFVKSEDKKQKLGKMFIYKATKADGKWANITAVSYNNASYNTNSPSLSQDGKTLYFSSDMPGGKGNTDIWKVAVNSDGTYGNPENLGEKVNTEGAEQFPFISSDNTLYFSSNGQKGFGGLDVFALNIAKNTQAMNLGKPINSERDDFGFTFNQTQNVAFLSSNREGGIGDDDIYLATPLCYLDLMVLVRDAKTGATLSDATVIMVDDLNKIVGKTISNPSGIAKFQTECDKPYHLNIEKQGYENGALDIDKAKGEITLNVNLKPTEAIVTETEVILNEIKFDYNKSNITQQGASELDKLVAVMNQYPEMVILAKSHTDSRGKNDYNLNLSDRRAKSTIQYIISKGIAETRISGQGMGETAPKVPCGDNCTEEEHAENRRSEFLIIKK